MASASSSAGDYLSGPYAGHVGGCDVTLRDPAWAQEVPFLDALQVENSERRAELAIYRRSAEAQQAITDLGVSDVQFTSNIGCCENGCCDAAACTQSSCPVHWFDACGQCPTVAMFVSGDGWRDFSELSYPNNNGIRIGIDTTWSLNACGLRGQLGAAYGMYDLHGRYDVSPTSTEEHVNLTAGVYRQASGVGGDIWTCAASYDYLNGNKYGMDAHSISLHQIRFLTGLRRNAADEFGLWGAFGLDDDSIDGGVVDVQDQVNLYWRHYYCSGGRTMLYAGLAQPNRSFDVSDSDDDLSEVVVGLRGIAPLTANLGLVGGVHYVIPSASAGNQAMDEETWNVTFGLIWVRGCSLPVLPVADNGWLGKRMIGVHPE
jgi:hypothetical protein